jgi:hypothetical protein
MPPKIMVNKRGANEERSWRRVETWPRLVGTSLAVIRSDRKQNQDAMEEETMRGVLLWLIGIPIPIIILLWLFGVLH